MPELEKLHSALMRLKGSDFRVGVQMAPMEAWIVMLAIQLVSHHPLMRMSRPLLERVGRALQAQVAMDPVLAEWAEEGWSPEGWEIKVEKIIVGQKPTD